MGGLFLILAAAAVYLFLVYPGQSSLEQRRPFVHRNFGHRGLYDNEHGVPENSLAAFEAAMEAGYGCELDVQFTSDKKLIVFHDNDLERMTGVPGKVWDKTFDEIRALRLAGTEERIPTFEEVLSTVRGRNPLIVEIKAEGKNNVWYHEVCEATAEALRDYEGDYCIESFHPVAVRWVWKHLPDVTRGLLVGGPSKRTDGLGFILNLIAELLGNFYCRPQFIAYRYEYRNLALRIVKRLGAFSVMWTVPDPQTQAELEKTEDCIIFEHYRPSVRFTEKE